MARKKPRPSQRARRRRAQQQSPNLGEPAEATMPAEQQRVVVNGGGRRPLKARTSTSQLGHVHAVQRRVVVSGEGSRPQPANQDKAPAPTKAPRKGRDVLCTNGTVKIKKESQGQTKHQSEVQGSDLRERREKRKKKGKKTNKRKISNEQRKTKTWARRNKPNHKRKEKSIKT